MRGAWLGLLVFSACASSAQAARPAALAWEESLAAGVARSRAEGRVLMVLFEGPECGPCARLVETVLSDPRVQRELAAFILARVDVSAEPGLARAFGVPRVPDVRFIDPDGSEELDLYGRSPGDVAGRLARVAEAHRGHAGR